MNTKPHVLILKTDGINCDEELSFAFKLAGGNPKTVHVNQLRSKEETFDDFQILAIPGGFCYGDDIVSGKILATELTSFFSDTLQRFIQRKNTLIIGICNGFQVLIRTGLLPFGTIGTMQATLTNNDSGHFECRWVDLKIDSQTACGYLQPMKDEIVSYQVAHGEGKFLASEAVLKKIEKQHLVALRYVSHGKSTSSYPANPNGSLHAIAGITDSTGRILGLMPHPERFVIPEQYPNWRRPQPQRLPVLSQQSTQPLRLSGPSQQAPQPQGLRLFNNMIAYAKEL